MSDLIKNLRDLAAFAHADLSVADEAADEIERLRKEKTELIKALEFYANPYGEAECVPDFYSELDFGELAQDAIAKATGGE